MITTRIQIDGGDIEDTYAAHGLIYLSSDNRTAPPMRSLDVSTYAEDDGEHTDPRFTWEPFDYKVKFLVESPNRNLTSANAVIAAFNSRLYEATGSGDVKRLRRVTFYNDYKRVKISGYATPIAEPTDFFRTDSGAALDCAAVELTIRADLPGECDFNVADVMRGRWLDSSAQAERVWYPGGEQTATPVDPASLRFDFHAGEAALTGWNLFTPRGNTEGDVPLASLDDVPASLSGQREYHFTFMGLRYVPSLPEVDLSSAVKLNAVFSLCMRVTRIGELRTSSAATWSYVFNRCAWLREIGGLWLDSAESFSNVFNGCSALTTLTLHNLGKGACEAYAFSTPLWGSGSDAALRSLRASLIDNTYDRAAAGLDAVTLQLPESVIGRLTDDEIEAITAKGYSIATLE